MNISEIQMYFINFIFTLTYSLIGVYIMHKSMSLAFNLFGIFTILSFLNLVLNFLNDFGTLEFVLKIKYDVLMFFIKVVLGSIEKLFLIFSMIFFIKEKVY